MFAEALRQCSFDDIFGVVSHIPEDLDEHELFEHIRKIELSANQFNRLLAKVDPEVEEV